MENAQGRFKLDFIFFVTSVQLGLPKNNVYTGLYIQCYVIRNVVAFGCM